MILFSKFQKRLITIIISSILFFTLGYLTTTPMIFFIVRIFYPEIYNILPSEDNEEELKKGDLLEEIKIYKK